MSMLSEDRASGMSDQMSVFFLFYLCHGDLIAGWSFVYQVRPSCAYFVICVLLI